MLAARFSGQGMSCCCCPSERGWSLLQPGAEHFHQSSLTTKKRGQSRVRVCGCRSAHSHCPSVWAQRTPPWFSRVEGWMSRILPGNCPAQEPRVSDLPTRCPRRGRCAGRRGCGTGAGSTAKAPCLPWQGGERSVISCFQEDQPQVLRLP